MNDEKMDSPAAPRCNCEASVPGVPSGHARTCPVFLADVRNFGLPGLSPASDPNVLPADGVIKLDEQVPIKGVSFENQKKIKDQLIARAQRTIDAIMWMASGENYVGYRGGYEGPEIPNGSRVEILEVPKIVAGSQGQSRPSVRCLAVIKVTPPSESNLDSASAHFSSDHLPRVILTPREGVLRKLIVGDKLVIDDAERLRGVPLEMGHLHALAERLWSDAENKTWSYAREIAAVLGVYPEGWDEPEFSDREPDDVDQEMQADDDMVTELVAEEDEDRRSGRRRVDITLGLHLDGDDVLVTTESIVAAVKRRLVEVHVQAPSLFVIDHVDDPIHINSVRYGR